MNAAVAILFQSLSTLPASSIAGRLVPEAKKLDTEKIIAALQKKSNPAAATALATAEAYRKVSPVRTVRQNDQVVEEKVNPTLLYGLAPLFVKAGKWEHALVIMQQLPVPVAISLLKKNHKSFPPSEGLKQFAARLIAEKDRLGGNDIRNKQEPGQGETRGAVTSPTGNVEKIDQETSVDNVIDSFIDQNSGGSTSSLSGETPGTTTNIESIMQYVDDLVTASPGPTADSSQPPSSSPSHNNKAATTTPSSGPNVLDDEELVQKVMSSRKERIRVSLEEEHKRILTAVAEGEQIDPSDIQCALKQQNVLNVLMGYSRRDDARLRNRVSLYWLMKCLENWQSRGMVRSSMEMCRTMVQQYKRQARKSSQEENGGDESTVEFTSQMKNEIQRVGKLLPFDFQVMMCVLRPLVKSAKGRLDGGGKWSMTWTEALRTFPDVGLETLKRRKTMRMMTGKLGYQYMGTVVIDWLSRWRSQVAELSPVHSGDSNGDESSPTITTPHDEGTNQARGKLIDVTSAKEVVSVVPWEQVTSWFLLEGDEALIGNSLSTRTLIAREMRLAVEWTFTQLFSILLTDGEKLTKLMLAAKQEGGKLKNEDEATLMATVRENFNNAEKAVGTILHTMEVMAVWILKHQTHILDSKIGIGTFVRGALMFYCEELLEIFFVVESFFTAYETSIAELSPVQNGNGEEAVLTPYVVGKNFLRLVCTIPLFYSPPNAETFRASIARSRAGLGRGMFSPAYFSYVSSTYGRAWITPYYCKGCSPNSLSGNRAPSSVVLQPITMDGGRSLGPISELLLEGMCDWETLFFTTRAQHDTSFQVQLLSTVTEHYMKCWSNVQWPECSSSLEQGPVMWRRDPLNIENTISVFVGRFLVSMMEVIENQCRWFNIDTDIPSYPFEDSVSNLTIYRGDSKKSTAGDVADESSNSSSANCGDGKSLPESLMNLVRKLRDEFSPLSIAAIGESSSSSSACFSSSTISQLRSQYAPALQNPSTASFIKDTAVGDVSLKIVNLKLNDRMANINALSVSWEEALKKISIRSERHDHLVFAPKNLLGFLVPHYKTLEAMLDGKGKLSVSQLVGPLLGRRKQAPAPYEQLDNPLTWYRTHQEETRRNSVETPWRIDYNVRARLVAMACIAAREGRNLELTAKALETALQYVSPVSVRPLLNDQRRDSAAKNNILQKLLFLVSITCFSRYPARAKIVGALSKTFNVQLVDKPEYAAVLKRWYTSGNSIGGSVPKAERIASMDPIDTRAELIVDPKMHVNRCINLFKGAVVKGEQLAIESMQEERLHIHEKYESEGSESWARGVSALGIISPIGPHVGVVLSGLLSIGDFVGMIVFYDFLIRLYERILRKNMDVITPSARATMVDSLVLKEQIMTARILISMVLTMRHMKSIALPHEKPIMADQQQYMDSSSEDRQVNDELVLRNNELEQFSFSSSARLEDFLNERAASNPDSESFDSIAVMQTMYTNARCEKTVTRYFNDASHWYIAAGENIGDAIFYLSWTSAKLDMATITRKRATTCQVSSPVALFYAIGRVLTSLDVDGSLVPYKTHQGYPRDYNWFFRCVKEAAVKRGSTDALMMGIIGDRVPSSESFTMRSDALSSPFRHQNSDTYPQQQQQQQQFGGGGMSNEYQKWQQQHEDRSMFSDEEEQYGSYYHEPQQASRNFVNDDEHDDGGQSSFFSRGGSRNKWVGSNSLKTKQTVESPPYSGSLWKKNRVPSGGATTSSGSGGEQHDEVVVRAQQQGGGDDPSSKNSWRVMSSSSSSIGGKKKKQRPSLLDDNDGIVSGGQRGGPTKIEGSWEL